MIEAAGVGYEVNISVATFGALPAVGAEASVHVHTHVREDALTLFGFATPVEKQLFERLISVSGIGPKLAIVALSGMSAESLVSAIRGNDLAQLTKIPGIGKKTAERMALELRDKLDGFGAAPKAEAEAAEEDVLSALVNLGYQRAAAEKAMSQALAGAKKGGAGAAIGRDFDALFREALGILRK